MGRRRQPGVDTSALARAVSQLHHATGAEVSAVTKEMSDEDARQKQSKRNIRVTATVLWVIVATIFFYMLAKYYYFVK